MLITVQRESSEGCALEGNEGLKERKQRSGDVSPHHPVRARVLTVAHG